MPVWGLAFAEGACNLEKPGEALSLPMGHDHVGAEAIPAGHGLDSANGGNIPCSLYL